MSDVGTELLERLQGLKGQPADRVTHAIKAYGGKDATMVDGLIKMVTRLNEDKHVSVTKAKVTHTAIGMGIVVGVQLTWHGCKWTWNQFSGWLETRRKNQELIQAFEKETIVTESENSITAVEDIISQGGDCYEKE